MSTSSESTELEGGADRPARGSRGLVVVALLLILAALAFSYLGTYAIGAAGGRRWSGLAGQRRPRGRGGWHGAFAALVVTFLGVGGAARFFSPRQLQGDESMAEE